MRCNEIQPLLSPFHDGELLPEQANGVAEHLETCSACASRLQSMQRLSALVTKSLPKGAPPSLLPKIERSLDIASHPTTAWRIWGRRLAVLVGASAALIIVTLMTWQMLSKPHSHGQMIDDFGEFLEAFARQPNESVGVLAAKYHGVSASEDDATVALKRPTVGRSTILDDHQLLKRYVLDMPCCRCVQTAYQRNGEVSLVVFEHDEPQRDWFGHRSAVQADCGDKSCCLVQVGDKLAGSWPLEKGHVTVVGIRDIGELESLVQTLQQE
jgi:hypothetical protein